uniref:Uncharacterized protein n=1 Tax=Arundo donax TaxID=35708 RepID=A0A0A9E8R5_ARUDO
MEATWRNFRAASKHMLVLSKSSPFSFRHLDKCFKSRASFSRTDAFVGFEASALRVTCFLVSKFSTTAFSNCNSL